VQILTKSALSARRARTARGAGIEATKPLFIMREFTCLPTKQGTAIKEKIRIVCEWRV